ncbi:MAG: DNA translocase FtsK [Clostridiales bacterium]|nr:DNA translocase FtsK [Clostridiales bacterium]MCF8023415.1 DNA translocase FtsK [Clostridiales bacterium]
MKNNQRFQKNIRIEIIGLLLLAVALLLALCLLNPAVGIISKYINIVLKALSGEGRFLFPVALGTAGVYLLLDKEQKKGTGNFKGFLLLLIVGLSLLHIPIPLDYAFPAGLKGDGGGMVGAIFSYVLQKSFGLTGTYIILVTIFIVGILILTNKSLILLFSYIYKMIKQYVKKLIIGFNAFLSLKCTNDKSNKKKDEAAYNYELIESTQEEQAAGLEYVYENEENTEPDYSFLSLKNEHENNQKESVDKTINHNESDIYECPPVSLLDSPAKKGESKTGTNISQYVRKLESTLHSFGIKAKVNKVAQGPSITRFEIQPPPGIKVSRIVNLADDIALGMAAPGVRIEAPVPGKAVMGIEVPNKEISMVYFRELIESPVFYQASSKLTLVLGKDVTGNFVGADLQKMPHLLIAGATGAGKSVCLNTIIASILFKAAPSEVKFLIIDPKMVELATFNGIPHLVSPVVVDPKKAATLLRWAVSEMEKRYEIFANSGVRDIFRYNKLINENKLEDVSLPLIVIIIDELSDLMMVAPAEVEDAICRLAQMSRAAGMHLVIATQRPSVDVITGLIKANIPSRISFAVSSGIDSRTVMDMSGAEKLMGKGDMLFYPVGKIKPLRVQGAYLTDHEVEKLVDHLKKQAVPNYEEKFDECESIDHQSQLEDVLLPRALRIILDSGQASISMLQRRLQVGYSRAARLIDIMERKGFVGGFEGNKPRTVIITRDQFEKTYNDDYGEN